MKLKFKELERKDYKIVIKYASIGMHFDWYMDNKFLLYLYGKYFWSLTLTRVTQMIALYDDNELVGVCAAGINGGRKLYKNIFRNMYIEFFNLLFKLFVGEDIGEYERANHEMYRHYISSHKPDGEILFLATNPNYINKGIGTIIVDELRNREKVKEVYLYTDSGCTYPFYEHKGFDKEPSKTIIMELGSKSVELGCYLYHIIL